MMELRAIKMFWQQGAGINLSVCGYSTEQSVLLELRYVALPEPVLAMMYNTWLHLNVMW
jgi:hypothetical protein